MDVSMLDDVHGSDLSLDELLSFLSQIVLTQVDSEVERRRDSLTEAREQYNELAKVMKTKKSRLQNLQREKSRLLALSRVVSLIDTLKREGKLIGKNREPITKILFKIQDYDFSKLRALEEKLSVHLPEVYSR